MRFLGHLDLMRYFQKALRRAHFPLEFSKGFHPHPIMSFAQPLSVGVTSWGEYFDVTLAKDIDLDEGLLALNSVMQNGISIVSIDKLSDNAGNAMSLVRRAEYLVTFKDINIDFEVLNKAILDLLSQKEIIITKKTKKSEITKDIKEFIYDIKVNEDSSVFLCLDASSENNVKPSAVTELLLEKSGIDKDTNYGIHRVRLILEE